MIVIPQSLLLALFRLRNESQKEIKFRCDRLLWLSVGSWVSVLQFINLKIFCDLNQGI